MATFTITTDVNIDTLSGRTGTDTYNINGGTLTIDEDTRYGVNAGTSLIMGNITLSSTLGGTIKIRGNKVRLIPFDNGSGVVPAYGTTISGATGSGKLAGVYANLTSAPTAPAAAMPSTGYIKIKQWNDGSFVENEALTGIGADVDVDPVFGGTDRAGWIEIVGNTLNALTSVRLANPSDDEIIGEWFDVGITNGTRATWYTIPSHGVAKFIGGVQVETSPGSGEYEWYPTTNVNMTLDNIRTSGLGSKVCYMDTANSRIAFGYDGTNSTGGSCPASGCKIRMGNVLLQSALSASPTANDLNAIPTNRYRVTTTSAGTLRMTKASYAWGMVTNTPYAISATDSSLIPGIAITSNATKALFTRVCIGLPITATGSTNQFPISINSTTVGATITDSVISGGAPYDNRYAIYIISSGNVTISNSRVELYGANPFADAALYCSIANDINIDNTDFCAGGLCELTQVQNITITDGQFAYDTTPVSRSTSTGYWVYSRNTTTNLLVKNWTFPHAEQGPLGDFIYFTTSANNSKIQNIATEDNPVNCRGTLFENATFTRSGTTATVTTSSPHSYAVDDMIVFYITSPAVSNQSLTVTRRRVLSVPTSTTFTTTAVNSGETSGTCSFYRSTVGRGVYVLSNCSNIEVQNVHMIGNSLEGFNTNNTTSGIRLKNVTTEPLFAGISWGASDAVTRGLGYNGELPATTSSQYGHSFSDARVLAYDNPVGSGAAATWTRSSTTVTVTLANHGFGNIYNRPRIFDSSNLAAMFNGYKTGFSLIDKDTFKFTGANTGTTSGTCLVGAETDRLTIYMNEESSDTQTYTIDAGTPAFTGAGTLSITSVGDQITWEMPEYLINYTGFSELPSVITNLTEHSTGAGGISCYEFYYDIAKDDGDFSGTFKNLFLPKSDTISVTGSSTTVTMADTTGIAVGDYVFGQTIALGTKVASVDSGTQITLDTNALDTSSAPITFYYLPNETFTTNFKLKIRIKCVIAQSVAIQYIAIPLTSDATSRAEVYPIPVTTVNISVTGIASGYRIQVYSVTQDTEIANTTTTGSTYSYVVTDEAEDGDIIRIRLAKTDKKTIQQNAVFSSTAGVTIPAEPEDDDVWTSYGVDGSTLTSIYSWDSANSEIEINEVGTTWSAKDLYAWYKYFITTATGIDEVFGLITALDVGNIQLGAVKLDNLDSNSLAPEDDIRVFRTDEAWIVRNPTTGGGDLGVYSTGTIYVKNINTATNVITGDIADVWTQPTRTLTSGGAPSASDIADAVWDEALSGHTTAGTAGKVIADTEANTDLTQAKVDQL